MTFNHPLMINNPFTLDATIAGDTLSDTLVSIIYQHKKGDTTPIMSLVRNGRSYTLLISGHTLIVKDTFPMVRSDKHVINDSTHRFIKNALLYEDGFSFECSSCFEWVNSIGKRVGEPFDTIDRDYRLPIGVLKRAFP